MQSSAVTCLHAATFEARIIASLTVAVLIPCFARFRERILSAALVIPSLEARTPRTLSGSTLLPDPDSTRAAPRMVSELFVTVKAVLIALLDIPEFFRRFWARLRA